MIAAADGLAGGWISTSEHRLGRPKVAAGNVSAMPDRRNPHAAMSALEVNALRRVQDGSADLIPQQDRDLLMRMGLVKLNGLGRMKLTEAGRQRLAAERTRAAGPTAQATNPFVRPAR